MKRNFHIENINSIDDVNKITILLNELEEVSRIKVRNTSISFECADDTMIKEKVATVDESLVIHEIVNQRKRVYKESNEKKETIFMFTNLETEEDASAIQEILSKYSMYEKVEIDFPNKLLKLVTNDSIALKRINRIIDKVNPNIDIEQWHKPFKSEDLFNQRYIRRYIRVGAFLVALAIGLVSTSDSPVLPMISWFIALACCSDRIARQVYRDIRNKVYLSEHLFVLVGCLMGYIYGRYVEAIIVVLLYQIFELITIKIISTVIDHIDRKVSVPVLGRKQVADSYQMVPLEEFDIGDKLVVFPGETVGLGGKIIEGNSQVDTFATDGNAVASEICVGQSISSGTINIDSEIIVEVEYLYHHSAFSKLIDIASLAPTYRSTSQKMLSTFMMYFNYGMLAIGILTPIITILINPEDNYRYLYFGAIVLSVSGTFLQKQASSFNVLAGVARAFQDGIIIKENSGLSAVGHCSTIIYDRFDGITVTDEELELFKKLKGLHKDLIIFNDGPITLENDQYQIHNDLTVEQKCEIMDKAEKIGPVLYIGDSSKDVALLQRAFVSVARGGLHDREVVENSDILLTTSGEQAILSMFKLANRQNRSNILNYVIAVLGTLIILLTSLMFTMIWPVAYIIYMLIGYVTLLMAYRLLK